MNIFIPYFCCYLNIPLNCISEVRVVNLSQETCIAEVFIVFLNLSRKMHGHYHELAVTTSDHIFGDSLNY